MKDTKGIILAGGAGSRLLPLTKSVSKQMLPVYDKPMIYYPLSTLMEIGLKQILIISTPRDLPRFKEIFKDGKDYGLEISYKEQLRPNGIAEAFIIADNFIGSDNVSMILGDNIFDGPKINSLFKKALLNLEKNYSTIFSTEVENPNDFGVIEFSENGQIKKITEKPEYALSNKIVSGLYFYTNDVINVAKNLSPSDRGELEITDVNNFYLNKNKLECIQLDSSFFWSDTGTYDSLMKASKYFQIKEIKTKNKSGCIEEIALRSGLIDDKMYLKFCTEMSKSDYGIYLERKLKELNIEKN